MRKDLNSIILECLTEVYRHTSPVADLRWIIECGKNQSLPDDWFEDYTIPGVVFESIVGRWIEMYGLKGFDASKFRTNMYLGPSPRFT